jgi:hypothetical protein
MRFLKLLPCRSWTTLRTNRLHTRPGKRIPIPHRARHRRHLRQSLRFTQTLPNTAVGASAVRQWICPRFTLSGPLLTALVSLYCACNARERCPVSRTYRSPTYILFLFNVAQITAAFAFLIFLVRARDQAGPQAAIRQLVLLRPSLDALSMVLMVLCFCGKRLGGFVSFGWGPGVGPFGGDYLSWFLGKPGCPGT